LVHYLTIIDIESQMLSHGYRQTNWYNLPPFPMSH